MRLVLHPVKLYDFDRASAMSSGVSKYDFSQQFSPCTQSSYHSINIGSFLHLSERLINILLIFFQFCSISVVVVVKVFQISIAVYNHTVHMNGLNPWNDQRPEPDCNERRTDIEFRSLLSFFEATSIYKCVLDNSYGSKYCSALVEHENN